MTSHLESSRRRYQQYKLDFKGSRATGAAAAAPSFDSIVKPPGARQRSFVELLRQFFVLLKGQGSRIAMALTTLTIATVLGLVPPAATKVVVDYVLIDNPLPAVLSERLHLPSDRRALLGTVALGIVVISLIRVVRTDSIGGG